MITIERNNERLTSAAVRTPDVPDNALSYDEEKAEIGIASVKTGTFPVVMAQYEGGKLVDIVVVDVEFTTTDKKNVALPEGMDAENMKVFFWGGFDETEPLCKSLIPAEMMNEQE